MTEPPIERDFLREAYQIARGETGPSGLRMLPQVEHLQALVEVIDKSRDLAGSLAWVLVDRQ